MVIRLYVNQMVIRLYVNQMVIRLYVNQMVIRLYVNQGSYIKPGKIYRDENTVYRFIKKVLKEVKYCK